MASTTQVPPLVINGAGVSAPPESAILAGTLADINAAFGGGMNTAQLENPLGQLASSMAAAIADKNDQFRAYVAGADPAYNAGRMQDGIARIYFITRNPAQPTVVQTLCTGLPGTIIPAGTSAKAIDGNLYVATAGGSIGTDGAVMLAFACLATGPIPCPAGSFARPYVAIPGWDTITNPADGVLGNVVESRGAFEERRRASVALNARDSLPSILANVLAVPDVLDAYATQNDQGVAATIGGVVLPPHSLYVAAAGGDPAAIAAAISARKSLGCSTVGNVTVLVPDTSYGQPYPSYAISFQRPANTPVLFQVTLAGGPDVPANAATLVQGAIIGAFAGADGGQRARIGGTLYASRFYAPVAALGPWVRIVDILVGLDAPTAYTAVLRIDQVPVVAPSDVSLVFA